MSDVGTQTELAYKKLGVLGETVETKSVAAQGDPPLHALIIGINKYANITNLKGAVKDAELFYNYLVNYLVVPDSQIKLLLDEQATRHNILEQFVQLRENPKINKGDPIVVFYAGHGAKLDKPEGWEASEDFIQALVPQDVKEIKDGKVVVAIPDLTIATLFNDLAEIKGDNITAIFDCCHSRSVTRLPTPKGPVDRFARYVPPFKLPPIPLGVDKDLFLPRTELRKAVVAKEFTYRELRSHVLLAACEAKELAYETNGAGDFTAALVKTLIENGADRTTYKGCIQRLPTLQKQNPQCEGYNKERVFFSAKVPGANRKLISVRSNEKECKLQAGVAQNITTGALFAIYNTDLANPSKDIPLGHMRVVKAEPTFSLMNWNDDTKIFKLPEISYAFQTRCGSDQVLKIHITERLLPRLPVDDEWHKAFTASQTNIVITISDETSADLILDLHQRTGKDRVSFDIRHALVNRWGVKEIPYTVPVAVDDILNALRGFALWIWHLNRNNPESSLGDSVKIEFKRVKREFGRGLVPFGDELKKSGIVDLVANPKDLYGMKLVNNSPYDLFPYLFYFDVNKQSIELWNDSTVGRSHTDAPLLRQSALTIGYGAGGAVPFAFEVDEDKEFELGMLKLYVTNLSTEFSSIAHESPFDFDPDGKRKNVPPAEVAASLAMSGVWHTVTVALIQRRPSNAT
ncbi:ICE-like protease (caspase) p20 domain protein [Ceratobasidium sp. AG-Ba]|nr:ICE-like protease (caspase) p20 domain protein [Ceratobasidium sp. AG-Ba]